LRPCPFVPFTLPPYWPLAATARIPKSFATEFTENTEQEICLRICPLVALRRAERRQRRTHIARHFFPFLSGLGELGGYLLAPKWSGA
jgi:hypothetical protein